MLFNSKVPPFVTVPCTFNPPAPLFVIVEFAVFETVAPALISSVPFSFNNASVPSLFVIVPFTVKSVPLLVIVALPVLSIVPLTRISPALFVISVVPILVIVPSTVIPASPSFKISKPSVSIIPISARLIPSSPSLTIDTVPSALTTLPVMCIPSPLPLLVIVALPLFVTVPSICRSPFVFNTVNPFVSTIPLISNNSPLLVMFVFVPVFVTVPSIVNAPVPLFVIAKSPALETVPSICRLVPLFIIVVALLLVTVPVSVMCSIPFWLVISNLPFWFSTSPLIVNWLPSFKIVVLPLPLTVPAIPKSPALFVNLVVPIFDTVPSILKPSIPLFVISKVPLLF